MKDPTFRRFWIEYERASPTSGRVYGVTAIDVDDALRIVESLPGHARPGGTVQRVIEDVDVATLDPGHVLPNMAPPIWRGVWYPNLGIERQVTFANTERDVTHYPRPLTERESDTLGFLLGVDDARAVPLKKQAKTAVVTERWDDGCASIDLAVDREHTPQATAWTQPFAEVVVEARTVDRSPRAPHELLLFVRDGWLKSIEIVHFDPDDVPKEFPPINVWDGPFFTPPLDRLTPDGRPRDIHQR